MARRLGARLLGWVRAAPEQTLAGRITYTFLFLGCIFALLLESNPVLYLTCSLLATVLLSALLTHLAPARLVAQRRLPGRVHAGQPFRVRLRIENRARWRPALGLGLRDSLQVGEGEGVARGPTLPVLPPGGVVEFSYPKRMHRRGIYDLGYAVAATRFPFGLFERRVLIECGSRLVVLPALGRLGRRARRDLTRPVCTPVAVRRRREGQEEFHSVREFLAGDNPRLIHWKTSARVGRLMRRVMRPEAAEDVTVLLDTCVDGFDAEQRRRGLERAVSCAATLLADAARRGRPGRVHFPGGTAVHSGSRAGLVPALEVLAGLRPSRQPPERLVERTPLRAGGAVVLLSLAGPARAARQAAARRGIRLKVWDVADDRFHKRYFARR